jgi:hypothetical protein
MQKYPPIKSPIHRPIQKQSPEKVHSPDTHIRAPVSH